MLRTFSRIAVAIALSAPLAITVPVGAAHAAKATPAAALEELLAADRSFSASAKTDLISALGAMFDEKIALATPAGTFTRSKAEAIETLRGNPLNIGASAEWTPVRGGISADGTQGYTLGFMTIQNGDKSIRKAKYLSYWVKTPSGWRVASYKRGGQSEGEFSTAPIAPTLPARIVKPSKKAATLAEHRRTIDLAERTFSDESKKIGLGPAFAKYGREDAVHLYSTGAGMTVGVANIARNIGTSTEPSTIHWGPDDVLVASSGDLGITWGFIHQEGPVPEGRPAKSPYTTVWYRPNPKDPWRYIAE